MGGLSAVAAIVIDSGFTGTGLLASQAAKLHVQGANG